MPPVALVVDVDGTLVDSTYEHVLAWVRAFRAHDVAVPAWRIHRAVGMGGDQLIPHVAGEDVERRLGDRIRETEARAYRDYLPHVRPFADAVPFIERCRALGIGVVLASSSKPHELERYLELLDARRLGVRWVSSGDVERTKPAPDLIERAVAEAGAPGAMMVGDATWDVAAARRADLSTIGLLTGGYGEDELREAGAVAVYERLHQLTEALPSWADRIRGATASAAGQSLASSTP
jgi:HAD superfamily hydrolase (TIGR01549 family)